MGNRLSYLLGNQTRRFCLDSTPGIDPAVVQVVLRRALLTIDRRRDCQGVEGVTFDLLRKFSPARDVAGSTAVFHPRHHPQRRLEDEDLGI